MDSVAAPTRTLITEVLATDGPVDARRELLRRLGVTVHAGRGPGLLVRIFLLAVVAVDATEAHLGVDGIGPGLRFHPLEGLQIHHVRVDTVAEKAVVVLSTDLVR